MQASQKRTAPADGEEGQEVQEQQPPRKLPERRSKASPINYNVRDYYRGMQFHDVAGPTRKTSSTQPRKKDTPRNLGGTCADSGLPGTQNSAYTHPTLPHNSNTSKPIWESCYDCIKELCQNPMVMRCRTQSGNSKCRHCEATNKVCVKIPEILVPRLVTIQKTASLIISYPRALDWSDKLSTLQNSLLVEYKIFQKEMGPYIASAKIAHSIVPSYNTSGPLIKAETTASAPIRICANTADHSHTTISRDTASATTPDTMSSILTHPSTPSTASTHISFAATPLLTMANPKPEVAMPGTIDRFYAVTCSTPKNENNEGIGLPCPSISSPPQRSKDSAPMAQIGAGRGLFNADAHVFGSPATVVAEENDRKDIQTASSDANTAPFTLGAELLTMIGSLESKLARIADALEAKNRSGNDDDRSLSRINRNKAYWE
ncbi:hypothetical protein AJ78_01825 [Emergomyces pasteurianus Ep9510]|uniref:Uncharacterized protein n=1 Tax=Emergomyces pasteurianus Ep9510 TaxID=1447872 RepID=A0A1J9QD40_9EURO|nr:hypothetical protein AJ78_01825 [Emergomyces pasteurianus Ep9510]